MLQRFILMAFSGIFGCFFACQDWAVSAAQPSRSAADAAEVRELPAGAPRASDVIIRALRLRKADGAGGRDTFRALRQFHVTRLEWAYIQQPEFVERLKDSGRLFGGAASSALSHVAGSSDRENLRGLCCVDLRGKPVIPTWKRTWNPPGNWWMCVNNPELEDRYVAFLQGYVDVGAEVIQRDEPWGNRRAVSWGGCFCDHCMQAFRDYLRRETTARQRQRWKVDDLESFDYRERLRKQQAPVGDRFKNWKGGELKERFVAFQEAATIKFHQRTRARLNEYAGRRVPMSCNNGCRRWTDIEQQFDWFFGELAFSHANPKFIHDVMRRSAQLQRCQVITMPKKRNRDDLAGWRRKTRQVIAMAYACGGQCMVPWDVYMPGDAPRYFGEPEQYADLFGFIRGASEYLDGYEYAGAFGGGIDCRLYRETPPIELSDSGSLAAVVRARPGRNDAPVVVHLIDWSAASESTSVTVNPRACSGADQVTVVLVQPAKYQPEDQRAAMEAGNFDRLVSSRKLSLDKSHRVTLPPLNPWGMLLVRPSEHRH